MEFIESENYEDAVREIKSAMIPYYLNNDLIWNDEGRLEQYKKCDLWSIRDSEEVGFIMTREIEGQFFLAELHIAPQYRNNGYGFQALEKASAIAASRGHAEIRIRVFKNNPAYELYLRSGYIMEKELPYTFQSVAQTHTKKCQSDA